MKNNIHPEITDINWNEVWNQALNKIPKKDAEKRWNKIAPHFDKWMKTDDYPQELTQKIHKEPSDTILDLGCGNGSITLELAKKVKQVTAVDLSIEMLNLITKKALKENITNINYLQSTIEDLNIEQVDKHDIVIASRSLNGIYNLQNELKKIDSIARKYVYITLWSATADQFDEKVAEHMSYPYRQHPDYIYAVNMLYQLGIYANVEILENQTPPIYCNMDDAIERYLWKTTWNIDEIQKTDKNKLENFLKKNLIQKDDGTLIHPNTKPRWVLIWWKKT